MAVLRGAPGSIVVGILVLLSNATPASAQDRGAARLHQAIRGLTVTTRVLLIGAHPDDDDTRLVAWLARSRRIETAYLSLTRGENGKNLIGNELGDGLGAIRTAESLAGSYLDGGLLFFTRAFDFGLSKSAEESYEHWPHDMVLGDVVTVIRAFRPHVVIALHAAASPPADGDGHHQVAGLLAREAYHLAGDTTRFPIAEHGFAWEPLKLYGPGTGLTIDIGGYDPVLGRTYADIAEESRARHRSQGYMKRPPTGDQAADRLVTLVREASRVNDSTPAAPERSLLDGIDTSFARLVTELPGNAGRALALAGVYADSARSAIDLQRPDVVVPLLARAARQAATARGGTARCLHPSADASAFVSSRAACRGPRLELDASLDIMKRRTADALVTAAGVSVEAVADRELVAFGDSVPVIVTIVNHGRESVQVLGVAVSGAQGAPIRPIVLPPDSVARWTMSVHGLASSAPWWFGRRLQDLYPGHQSALDGLARAVAPSDLVTLPGVAIPETLRRASDVTVTMQIARQLVTTSVGPIVFRAAEPLLGVQERPVSGVSPVTLQFDHSLEWIPTRKPIDRLLRLTMRSFADSAQTLALTVVAPPGVRLDSLPSSIRLQPGERREILLRLRGNLKAGRFEFGVIARSPSGVEIAEGFRTIQYPHLPPIRLSRSSGLWLQAVDITVPIRLNAAYVQGVGDVITPFLRQLGVPVTLLDSDELLNADLSQFTTVVIGTRAYEARPELVAFHSKLLEFARKGGTVVVQSGTRLTYELGVFPHRLALAPDGPEDRVTVEGAPVTVLDPASRILTWPNRIGEADWKGWVLERAAFMPRIIDERYSTPLEMHDPGEPENRGALVITRLGKGTYIYTTLALHRQLPGAVPGAARLFVNLLSAGLPSDPRPVQRSP